MSIDWVFFDMGGVLVDDEPAMLMVYRRLHERCKVSGCPKTHDEIFSLRERLIAEGDGAHWHSAGKILLGEEGWRVLYADLISELREHYAEFNIPFPGVGKMLASTAGKLKVGLAANQLTECRSLLERQGWIGHFDILGISEEMGCRKPKPEFFHWLLDKAGVEPGRCIMVGDRIDNDITPAKGVGFRTIWFRMNTDYGILATGDDFAHAYVASHRRAAIKRVGPVDVSQEPDFIADSPEDMLKGISVIADR